MAKRLTSQQVYDVASEWAAKVDASPLTQDERAILDAWLSVDVRHFGAFAQASAHLTALTDSSGKARARLEELRSTRRRFVLGGSVAAGITGLAVAGAFALRYFGTQSHTTRI